MRYINLLFLSFLLVACSSKEYQIAPLSEGFLIGELYPATLSRSTAIENISTNEVIETYRELLPYVDDAGARADIMARVGDLETLLQEQLADRAEKNDEEFYLTDYSLAVDAYLYVLEHYPERAENDVVLYHLAKAYDVSGDGENAYQTLSRLVAQYPYSEFFLESQFRRGDYLFANKYYDEAIEAYQTVVDAGSITPFYENALYMHGWSLFKEALYEPALESFTLLMDISFDVNKQYVDDEQTDLVSDTIRVMAISFTYLGGPSSIERTYEQLGSREYESVLYERLGDLFVEKERYSDAISSYRHFVNKYPMHDQAPVLHNKVIDAMLSAKQGSSLRDEKEVFAEQYHPQGDYFLQASEERKTYLLPYLYAYLDEAGRFYHARAQREKQNLKQFKQAPVGRVAVMEKDYTRAIAYYEDFINTFPDDVHAGEKSFFIAEAYSELKQFEMAIVAYERTAYDYGLHHYSEAAAYSAVLGHRELVKNSVDEEQKRQRLEARLEAQLRFVDNFAHSQFAKPVLLDSIDMFYAEKDYRQAVSLAERFLALEPPGTEKERYTVSLVLGHGYFELMQYNMAEKAYLGASALASDAKERREIDDRVAASIYRHAEALAEEGQIPEAIDEFLRVVTAAPHSQYRKNAEYDAATYLLMEEQWQQALDVLVSYRARYDANSASLDVTSKFLAAYEGLEDYKRAADELVRVSELSREQQQKQESLYLAAEYYEKAGDDERALSIYRSYVHAYPSPFLLAIEVRYKLSEMYRKQADEERRRYWLEQIIISDSRAGSERSDRSRYLAAMSRNVFAEDYLAEFDAIKLTLPLNRSLPAKTKAMQEAQRRYEQILNYQVQEFTTQSMYRIAYLYGQFSRDLMNSERPAGLDELELEQYEMMLEDEAYPFEEIAIEAHEANVANSWAGFYDQWVQKSIDALAKLSPGRYNKKEKAGGYSDVIY